MKRDKWGEQGPPINAVANNRRIVASYNQLLELPPDATYHDFLGYYIKHVLGEDWWRAEAELPEHKAHQLIHWQRKVQAFQLKHASGSGVQSAPGKGVTGHYYRLAFDLHTLKHQGHIQDRLVKRLKNKGNFQGARYEVTVCAAFVRAGFDITLPNEQTSPQKVSDLTATHRQSGVSYTVEAKSRHIPGVLGHPKLRSRRSSKEPRITDIIKSALGKPAGYRRIICIDVNFPQTKGQDPASTWGPAVRRQVNALEALGRGPAVLILTNSPLHYLEDDQLGGGSTTMVMGLTEPNFDPKDLPLVESNFPGLLAAANAFGMAIPGDWD